VKGRPATPPRYPDFDGTQVCAQADPEDFFPEVGGSPEGAKTICRGGTTGYRPPCAFLNECLSYALMHDVVGVWGGTSGKQRLMWRRANGVTAFPVMVSTGQDRAATARRMHARGTAVTEIAAHLGVTTEAVHRILRAEQREAS
jgi:hypothetical protein